MGRMHSVLKLLKYAGIVQLVLIVIAVYVYCNRNKNVGWHHVMLFDNVFNPPSISDRDTAEVTEMFIDANRTGDNEDEICAAKFLLEYRLLCNRTMLGRYLRNSTSVTEMSATVSPMVDRSLCPCVPSTLEGTTSAQRLKSSTYLTEDLLNSISQTKHGGSWAPTSCVARQRVAIIIPFRDRDQHLLKLLGVLHPMLQRQLLDYTIFVIEQNSPELFNKAMLMNAGFSAATRQDQFDCFIFHDVDLLPLDDRNFYTCSPTPRHVAAFIDKWEYRVWYDEIFGGAVAFRPEDFRLANGFSNTYFGWGGEDDDMFQRTRAANFTLHVRHPQCVAKYDMIVHTRDYRNPSLHQGHRGHKFQPEEYQKEGLKTVSYTLKAIDVHPLYTQLLINLPPTPKHIEEALQREKQKADSSTEPNSNSSAKL